MKHILTCLFFLMLFVTWATGQCNCTDSQSRFSFQTSAQIQLSACIDKKTTLGSQTVYWCLVNQTGDALEVSFTKVYELTCGNTRSSVARIKVKPYETIGKWDLAMVNAFYKEDCQNEQKLARVNYSDLIIGRNAGTTQNTVTYPSETTSAGNSNGRQNAIDQQNQDMDRLTREFEATMQERQRSTSQIDDAFRQLADYLTTRTRNSTLQRLQQETRSAFDRLKSDIQQGYKTETCNKCYGDGTEQCTMCNGAGVKSCYICNGGGKTNCWTCRGTGMYGTILCASCSGTGGTTCTTCQGRGNLACTDCLAAGFSNCSSCSGTGKVTSR